MKKTQFDMSAESRIVINRSTFDEDMGEKRRFLHFRSQWPWPSTFRPQVCSLDYSLLRLSGFEKIDRRRGMDRRRDERVQRLMRAPTLKQFL